MIVSGYIGSQNLFYALVGLVVLFKLKFDYLVSFFSLMFCIEFLSFILLDLFPNGNFPILTELQE